MSPPFRIFLAALAAVLALVTFAANADDRLSWQHPTQYTDSAPLALDAIESTIIRYGVGTSANPPTLLSNITVPAPATSAVVPRDVAVAGTVCYQASTLLKAVPPSTDKGQSIFAPAAWVCKTQAPLPAKKPRAPRNLSVQ